MTSKGVSTKPILLISGYSPFCETFFDNVRVPKSHVVGTINRGWDVAKYLLGHEREMISGMGLGGEKQALGAAVGGVEDPLLRAEIAAFDVDALAFAAMSERSKQGARPRAWLRTKANSIEGGTSEVMLGIVAKRILDLPGA
jgi:alkylation response protein AidB-like acyl-CoA dehydrogenase